MGRKGYIVNQPLYCGCNVSCGAYQTDRVRMDSLHGSHPVFTTCHLLEDNLKPLLTDPDAVK